MVGEKEHIPEVEVTPEMIEAGTVAFLEWDSRVSDPQDLVVSVFEAMLLARCAA